MSNPPPGDSRSGAQGNRNPQPGLGQGQQRTQLPTRQQQLQVPPFTQAQGMSHNQVHVIVTEAPESRIQEEGMSTSPTIEMVQREISAAERSEDIKIREKIRGRFVEEYAGFFLVWIVQSAPHALNQRFKDITEAEKLLVDCVGIWDVMLDDWERGNFDRTRRLKVLQSDAHTQALGELQRYGPVYKLLVLSVLKRGRWDKEDIKDNNCFIHHDGQINPSLPIIKDLVEFQNSLSNRRQYPSSSETDPDFKLSKTRYGPQFDKVFVKTPQASAIDAREYLSFFVLNHCFLQDTISASQDSSNFKAGAFCHFFIHTPFLYIRSSSRLEYKQDQQWKFPVLLKLSDDTMVKYTPKSDWMVTNNIYLCPTMISEVVSQKSEEDEQRMLMQAIAAVRIGQYITGPKNTFFLVAVYLTAKLEARRYILASDPVEIDKVDKNTMVDKNPKVRVLCKRFDLRDSNAANNFFLEMLNLKTKVEEMSEQFNCEHEKLLTRIHDAAGGLQSLHSKDKSVGGGDNSKDGGGKTNQNLGARGRGLSDAVDGGGVYYGAFQADELQEELDKMGYKILYASALNPNLAVVQPKHDPEMQHYVKFIPEYSNELRLITYLNSLRSPSNCIIRPIGSSMCSSGSLMAMLGAGRWITGIKDLAAHLPDLVMQLLKGVQFLHDNLVAHLDLKPENLLASTIDPTDPKLTIIDFSCAVRVGKHSSLVDAVRGTGGYMAPEIGSGPYNPFKADIWSFGVVLTRLCNACGEFPERSLLLMIAAQLMQLDPNRRPALSEILQQIRDVSPQTDAFPETNISWKMHSFSTKSVSVF